jgi:hypothetical protein
MKKFLLLFLACFTSLAVDQVTINLAVTNTPLAHDIYVVNAKTITWTNSTTAAPSTTVLIGASIGASATNLFRQLATYALSGPVTLGFSSSNIISIRGAPGQTMASSLATNWGVISLSTNTTTPMSAVRVPLTSEPTQSSATNIASLLATGLGTHSTNALAAGTTLVGNLVQTTTAQTIAGVKTFSSAAHFTSTLVNSNAAPTLTIYETDAAADEKIAEWASEAGVFSLKFYSDDRMSDETVFLVDRTGDVPDIIRMEWPTELTATNSTVIDSTITRATLTEENYSTGIFGHTRANNTSLANGNNAGVDFGEKVYVKLKAGPTGAFAICGIDGGADGRMLIIDNSIAQNMTIANDSGVEPVAANRIYTRTGSDVVTTGQGVVTLIYDSEDSRWILVSVQL